MADASQSSPGRLAGRQFPSTVRTAVTGESALQQATRLMEHLRKQLEELDRREANLNRQLIAFDNERRGLKLLAQQLETQATHREQQLAHVADVGARAASEGDVVIMGGGDVIGQALDQGLVDELRLHLAPMVLGGGTPLFRDGTRQMYRQVDVRPSRNVVHLAYERQVAAP